MTYKILNSSIFFQDGAQIQFNSNGISQVIEQNGVLIVISENDQDFNNNVYGIDMANKALKWQIKNPKKFTQEAKEAGRRIMEQLGDDSKLSKYYTELRCPFTDMGYGKHDNLLYYKEYVQFCNPFK